jgi:hypothetical protein
MGLYGWLLSLIYARQIPDTPTSRIASAAQGYVELYGRGVPPLGRKPLKEPLQNLPALWYRIDADFRSHAPFLLDDGSGRLCAIDPRGAQILTPRKEIFQIDGKRCVVRSLLEGDHIYVIGNFVTLGSILPDLDAHAQISELLAQWELNRSETLARFDHNRDGQIDPDESALERAEARREVLRTRREAVVERVRAAPTEEAWHEEILRMELAGLTTQQQAHIMTQPDDGRLYLISGIPPALIARRYKRWAIGFMTLFLVSLAALTWIYGHHLMSAQP